MNGGNVALNVAPPPRLFSARIRPPCASTMDREMDRHLHSVDVTALFPRAGTNVVIRADMHLSGYVRELIQMIVPAWKPAARGT